MTSMCVPTNMMELTGIQPDIDTCVCHVLLYAFDLAGRSAQSSWVRRTCAMSECSHLARRNVFVRF